MDWPAWRGPHQDGTSREIGLIDRFDPRGGPQSNVLWKSEAAAGISTPIAFNGRVMTIVRDSPGTIRDAEKVICLDAETGEVVWENIYNVFLSDLPAERVGWSNLCGDPSTNRVYALGACCLLQCIDAETGETQWARSLSEEFGMLSTYGGRTNTPVLFENLVIISGVTTGWDETARPAHRFYAFDRFNGQLVWVTGTRPLPEDTTYSTPVIRNIDGQPVLIAGSGDGSLYAMQPRTGKILWSVPLSRRGINTSPAVDDSGHIYAGHGEENPRGTAMGAIVRIDAHLKGENADETGAPGAEPLERWRTEELMVGKSSPLLVRDRLYVVEDSSRLHVLDVVTGQQIGEPMKLGTAMRGSLLYADGKIFACTSSGVFHILRPSDSGVESLFKVRLPRGHEVGGSPIVSHGRLYLPTTGGLFCLGNASIQPQLAGEDSPEAPNRHEQPEGPVKDLAIATLRLVPAEALIRPGDPMKFQLTAFNAAGQPLAELPADLHVEVSGGGSIDNELNFTADASSGHQAATVTVSAGGQTAASRLRIIPPLPWSFDFSDGEVPVTWIGARYRHEIKKVDGKFAMVKITTIPKGTRSQTWFGPTDLHDYTVTADMMAQSGPNKLPDMGLIAQRYTLDLMGESQQLQIRTWTAQLRMAQSISLAWQPGVWYTLKFQASTVDGTSVLRGKVWPRDEPEPEVWMLTATDPSPNLQGSPGLFGNATNAEITIDHVRVESNE
ncbi:outer membrane protein assembly factor BamB family protein [Roseiconus nitratireducens]|nr:PQQ-binding-like beta-propeller repeat protein [Roseiconus nitratireducens]